MTDNFFVRMFKYFKHAWKELLIIALVAFADLLTKNIVEATMYLGQDITIIPNLFYFTYVLNKKAAYSMSFGIEKIVGEGGVITFFIVLTIIALIIFGLFMWLMRKRMFISRLSLALIIGGAFGNLVDRIVLSAVRDFIRLEFFGVSLFGCFNIADMALVFGVILFAVYFIFLFDRDEKRLKGDDKVVADGEKPSQTENDENVEKTEENSENQASLVKNEANSQEEQQRSDTNDAEN